ncbi:DUF1559 family PulG-like putative transporter [Gimesia algae]|uniref:DUF1559 domain-containing protein n=1 Tax=Gimesia algae TaxID=2527971 RepID=A0A517VL67_9PLAN|nr:DUF1559 domain-containing protein [Gimesia algae]QDT93761.1 hypothetical protein Pan161_54460 [Gimesia algae]
MQIQRTRQPRLHRNGFSKIELLVVLFVIALLMLAVIMPMGPSSHGPARKLVCLNNMRNLGLATVNFSSGNNSELPLLVDPYLQISTEDEPNANASYDDLTWCTTLLPFLDNVGFRQRWDATANLAADTNTNSDAIKQLAALNAIRFPVFSCPSDESATDQGALSYVVNVGYVTANYNKTGVGYNASTGIGHHPAGDGGLDGDPSTTDDIPVKYASGVFWRPFTSRMSLDFISEGDGLAQTLMLSENLQAGNWADQDTGSLGFGIDMQGVYPSGSTSLKLPAGFDLKNKTTSTDSRIGSNLKAKKGQAWRPSSNHPGGSVNVIFCDGSGKSLAPEIDPAIYARLLTPAGQRYGQAEIEKGAF